MTQTSQSTMEQPPRAAESPPASRRTEPSAWTGWVIFAGAMLVLSGVFQAIEGLVALFRQGFYLVGANGLLVQVNYSAWGWTHLVLGAASVLAGLGLFVGNLAARIAGIVLAAISAVVNLAFISAYPVWATIVIALDVIVIYAITVHGGELKESA
ncbi:DUF7144 family membrane protein [Amnibacterium sp.]|uniref:DUF7144 family membrane protein n=1 Tax=Amnibacterium sp. TaxID=1872496 RepID=UPI003F7C8190